MRNRKWQTSLDDETRKRQTSDNNEKEEVVN